MRKHYGAAASLSVYALYVICLIGCARTHQIEKINAPSAQEEVPVILEKAETAIRRGEKLAFSIRWLGLEAGTADVEVKKEFEKINGRKAYHIEVRVRSNSLIDLVYPVRDEHHSYIDKEHFHSLRYEKILKEGRYRADEVMEYDQENHTALYTSRRNGAKKQMMIPKNVQDQVSGTFWFRAQPMKAGDSIFVPVNTDEKNWNLEIRVLERDRIEIGDLGTFDALRLEPLVKFQGIFVKRGKMTGWMSTDDRRLPLLMKTKIPVLGSIHIVLVDYEPR